MAGPTPSSGWPGRGRPGRVGLTALILVGVLAACGTVPPSPTAGTSPSAVELARLVADGVVFEYPAAWRRLDVSGHTSFSDIVAALAGGSAPPCPAPCDLAALRLEPGSLLFLVSRFDGLPLDGGELIPHPNTSVAGLPAEVERATGGRNGADATLTWRFPVPRSVRSWYELVVRLRGPGEDELEAEARAVVRSARADPPLVPLPTDRATLGRIVGLALDRLAADSTAFLCFPRDLGERTDVVGQDVWGTDLDRPLWVRCAVDGVEPTVVGLWQLRLSLRRADGSPGSGIEELTIWVDSDGAVVLVLVKDGLDLRG